MVEEPTGGESGFFDVLLTNNEELTEHLKMESNLGKSNHKMIRVQDPKERKEKRAAQ